LYAAREVVGHFFGNVIAADDEQHFGGAIRKKHRRLSSRVTAPDDNYSFVSANLTFERGSRVINPNSFEAFTILRVKPAIVRAISNQPSFCAQKRGTAFDLNAGAVFAVGVVVEREHL